MICEQKVKRKKMKKKVSVEWPTPFRRTSKWARRRRKLLHILGSVFVVVFFGRISSTKLIHSRGKFRRTNKFRSGESRIMKDEEEQRKSFYSSRSSEKFCRFRVFFNRALDIRFFIESLKKMFFLPKVKTFKLKEIIFHRRLCLLKLNKYPWF